MNFKIFNIHKIPLILFIKWCISNSVPKKRRCLSPHLLSPKSTFAVKLIIPKVKPMAIS